MTEPTLGDLCSSIVDCEHKTAPITSGGGFFAVGTPAMRNNLIDYAESRELDEETYLLWTRRLRPRFGDLLLAREAPVGPVVQIPPSENVAPGQRTVLLRPNQEVIDPRFLYYYLMSPSTQSDLLVKASGSTTPHLNVADVRTLPVSGLPDRSGQTAISEVLGALDDKIAANTALVDASEKLALTVIQRATGRVPLSAVATHRTEMVQPSAFPASVGHFSLPAFDAGVVAWASASSEIKSGKFLLRRPSVLFSKLNPRIPRIWDVRELTPGTNLASTEFVVLEPIDCSTTALWAAVSQPGFVTQVQEKVSGTTGSHQRVNPAAILATVMLDPRTLSHADAALIDGVGAVVAAARAESAQLAAARDELLSLLIPGRGTVRRLSAR